MTGREIIDGRAGTLLRGADVHSSFDNRDAAEALARQIARNYSAQLPDSRLREIYVEPHHQLRIGIKDSDCKTSRVVEARFDHKSVD